MHLLGCCSTFGKRKKTLACSSSIFTLSESLATSLMQLDHTILHGKPFGIPLSYMIFVVAVVKNSWTLCLSINPFIEWTSALYGLVSISHMH
jgi:hypothetical protein